MPPLASDRAVSPVVGVALLVVITVLLAGSLTFVFNIDVNEQTADRVANGNLRDEADDGLQDDLVVAEDPTPGTTDIVHSTVVEVDDASGTELDSITVDYPKDDMDLSTQEHNEILTIGVDTNGDGSLERTFDESDISGVNTNDDNSELTVTFDIGYTFDEGDRVKIRYEGVNNPDAAGDYAVSVTLNGAQTEDGTLTIG